jgi:hypothetical protein
LTIAAAKRKSEVERVWNSGIVEEKEAKLFHVEQFGVIGAGGNCSTWNNFAEQAAGF